MLVSLSVDTLKVNLLLRVGDDFADVKLQELIKETNVRSQGDVAGNFANDGSKVWLTRRRLVLFRLVLKCRLLCTRDRCSAFVVRLARRENWRRDGINGVGSSCERLRQWTGLRRSVDIL